MALSSKFNFMGLARTRPLSFLRFQRPNPWQLAAFLITVAVCAPLAMVLSSVFSPSTDVWRHLVETVLVEVMLNTIWLVLGVGVGTLVLGVSLAWLTAACEFPGRRFFDWALMLPLALPAYVTAFVSIGLLDYTGPVQTFLRSWLGEGIWFPRIRSTGGVILVMTLALYPYVYLLARNAFLTQGRRAIEVAQSLGHSRWGGFYHVSLPMARPWIVGGSMLALMETVADFGAVSTFNYDTLTTAIYKAWFGMFSLSAAAQLSSLLILIVFVLLVVEQQWRLRMRYGQMGRNSAYGDRVVLRGIWGGVAFTYSVLILSAGFLIPVVQLSVWAYGVFDQDFDGRYLGFVTHSLLLGGVASLLTCTCALILVYASRQRNGFWTRFLVRLATMGYALPGTVLAVGVFLLFVSLDHQIIHLAKVWFGAEVELLLTGTLLAMLLAYLVRFLAVAHSPLESAMQRVTSNIEEAARSLGCSGIGLLRRIHLPILRGGLLTATTLVFVDVMKEMPITLMTRPFGWDTLSVRIFEMTSEGEWERAALPAVVLVLAGLVPVMLLTKHEDKGSS